MCLITVSTGKLLDRELFQRSYSRNNDGMGFFYKKDGRVVARKFVGPEQYLWEHYQECADIPHALHHRFATSGGEKVAMAHPFRVLEKDRDGADVWLMHNGVFNGLPTTKKQSDTFHFVQMLRPFISKNPDLVLSSSFRLMMNQFCGTSNRVCMLTSLQDEPILFGNFHEKGPYKFSNTYSIEPPFQRHVYRYGDFNDACEIRPRQLATVETTVFDEKKKFYPYR